MDILKQSLAPITDEAWGEISSTAKRTLAACLSARKVVDVDGPHGWDYSAVTLGRLDGPKKPGKSGVEFGVRNVLPLVETRAMFDLNIWELDNAVRGAEDLKLDAVEEAARNIARFEETAVYEGLSSAGIKGLKASSDHKPLKFSGDISKILDTVSNGIVQFAQAGVEGPYVLVAGNSLWQQVASHDSGYPLKKHLERILGSDVVLNPFLEDSLLVSTRGGDMKLTLGADLAIGFNSATSETVRLYLTESFTFRVLDGSVILPIEWRKK